MKKKFYVIIAKGSNLNEIYNEDIGFWWQVAVKLDLNPNEVIKKYVNHGWKIHEITETGVKEIVRDNDCENSPIPKPRYFKKIR